MKRIRETKQEAIKRFTRHYVLSEGLTPAEAFKKACEKWRRMAAIAKMKAPC